MFKMRRFLLISVACIAWAEPCQAYISGSSSGGSDGSDSMPDQSSLPFNYEAEHETIKLQRQKTAAEDSSSTELRKELEEDRMLLEGIMDMMEPEMEGESDGMRKMRKRPRMPSRDGRRRNRHLLDREKRRAVRCDPRAVFRSADGSCNNLANPTWGSVNQVYQRLLDPVYDDGKDTPRLNNANGNALPSPRTVSAKVHDGGSHLDRKATIMLMEWGQFLAHDLTGTPTDKDSMTTEDCCSTSLVTRGRQHSDVDTGGPCFPILIEEGDKRFKTTAERCMEFVRSFPVTDDDGVRQQISELSSYIDGTNVYGVNDTEMERLRNGDREGKLYMAKDDNLPASSTNFCIKDKRNDYCMDAGDSRVNAYPGLGAMHTVFARYHNFLAEELKVNHPDWDSDQLFHTARKIVIAVMQRITFDEYLPIVLGNSAMTKYGLNTAYNYDSSCDATLYNVFSTAAFRFGHSMVTDSLTINGKKISTNDLILRPTEVLNNLDGVLTALVTKSSEKVDRWYSTTMTDHLFGDLDIASLNIQRGRDHGLPSYNKWRQFCGLSPLTRFSQLPKNAVKRFTKVYGDPDDIDLYSGALTESGEGKVGPTYACLLGLQFAKLRNCDRFWWETQDPDLGFTEDQRLQIGKTKLSHVICQTTGVGSIQENVLGMADRRRNKKQNCANIMSNAMDVSVF